MSGAVFLLLLYVFIAWTAATLPFTFIISVASLFPRKVLFIYFYLFFIIFYVTEFPCVM